MAGSFRHCDKDREFRFDLIENMGDAHEACEEMHWLIWYLANGKKKRIKKALKAYRDDPATPRWLHTTREESDGR